MYNVLKYNDKVMYGGYGKRALSHNVHVMFGGSKHGKSISKYNVHVMYIYIYRVKIL